MAIFSGSSLIRTLSLFHLTLSYYLLTAPSTLSDQNLVFMLGAAMDMPQPPPSLSIASSSTSLAGILLALLALSDFTNSNLPEEVASYLWSSQAPVRLAFFFGLTGFSYLAKTAGKDGIVGKERQGMRGSICNSFVFTWAFLELLAWFYVSLLLI